MNELTTQNPFALTSFEAVEKMAKYVSDSQAYGFKTPAQVITAMMLAHDEGTTLAKLMKRVHFHEDGKISQRADYTQADFEQNSGWIIWHIRDDEMVCGTFGLGDAPDDEARKRGVERFKLMWKKSADPDPTKRSAFIMQLAELSREGEETVLRTFAECQEKGITEGKSGTKANWRISPKGMLTARCVTDGVNAVDPSRRAGFSSEDEVQDVRDVEQKTLVERASAPQSNDLEAMKAILKQHEENALAATTESERKRYQGLAADMRIVIQEAWDKEKPAKAACSDIKSDGGMDPRSAYENNRALPPIPVKEAQAKVAAMFKKPEPPDDVPMTHPTDPVKTVEAKVDQVEPPKKEPKKVAEKPAEPAPTEKKVTEGSNDPVLTDLSKWAEYKLQMVPAAAYKGKALGAFAPAEISVLYKKRSLPFLNSEDPALKLEAQMIQQAHDGGDK